MMLTINELSKRTGISAYEIRRRVHAGSCPHTRVGAKQSKILIDEDDFIRLLEEESRRNMADAQKRVVLHRDMEDNVGYGSLRRID